MKTKPISRVIYHICVLGVGLIMIYPLVWMLMSSFKHTNTTFTTAGQLIPEEFTLENYFTGWKGFGKVSFKTFFLNSGFITVLATIGTVASSAIVAYGFSHCKFRGRGILFAFMLVAIFIFFQKYLVEGISTSGLKG